MVSMDINAVERTLRADAADKAVATADTYGWTELRWVCTWTAPNA